MKRCDLTQIPDNRRTMNRLEFTESSYNYTAKAIVIIAIRKIPKLGQLKNQH